MMTKKEKILYIATEYAPGMIPFAASIINAAMKQNVYVAYAFCVNYGNKSYKKYLSFDNERCFYYEYPKSKIKKIIYKFYPYEIIHSLKRIIKEKSIDKVHLLTGDFSMTLMNFSSIGMQKNIFYTVHDLHPHTSNSMSCLGKLLHRHVLNATKNLILHIPNLTTCSKSQYKELKMQFPSKNVSFSQFPSLVTSKMKDGTMQVPELKGIKDYILFFGTIDHYKGVDDLVKAYLKSDCCGKCKLVIAGKGKIDIIDSADIIWLNRFILDEEISDLFKKARLVVYPYKNITMSGVLSIALYFAKHIICSNLDFFEQYKNDSISYFIRDNVENLSECLDREYLLAQSPVQNVYKNYFSEKKITKDLLTFYGLN